MPRETEHRLCDGGDDTHFATAARTGADVDREHPMKSLHPAHRARGLGLDNVVTGLRCGRMSGNDVIAMFGIRGKQAVIAHQSRSTRHGGCLRRSARQHRRSLNREARAGRTPALAFSARCETIAAGSLRLSVRATSVVPKYVLDRRPNILEIGGIPFLLR